MKITHLKSILRAAIVTLLGTAVAHASTSFSITFDTSTLPASEGPYQLYFSLLDGDGGGDANNTVVLSNWSCSGCPTGSLSLTDSSFFEDLYVPFVAGGTISFHVSATANADVTAPDTFQMSLLDGALNPLPTTDPFAAVLLTIFDRPAPQPQGFGSATGSSTPFAAPLVSAPEPVFPGGLAVCALATVLAIRRRPGRQSCRTE